MSQLERDNEAAQNDGCQSTVSTLIETLQPETTVATGHYSCKGFTGGMDRILPLFSKGFQGGGSREKK